ncbi:unnamed protein product, partial [Ascophyllum nodosum]
MWDTSLRGPIRYVIWREVPHFSRSGVECEAHRFLISGRDRPRELLFDSTRKELKMEGKTEVTGQKNLGGFEDDNWFLPMLEQVSRISTKPPPNKARLECFGRVL